VVAETVRKPVAEWDASLYNAKHDFVWKCGCDVVFLLNPRSGERILDLGCGTGDLSAQIAESGAQVTGVNRSAEMVGAARLAYPNLKFQMPESFRFVKCLKRSSQMRRCSGSMNQNLPSMAYGGRFAQEEDLSRSLAETETFARCRMRLTGRWRNLARRSPEKCGRGVTRALASIRWSRNGLEVRFITLFDRPTGLANGAAGMRNWIMMFAGEYLAKAGDDRREKFLLRVEELLRPNLIRDGPWWADYRRLRLVAYK
jgi:SAM-dependent methyltransferase